MNSQAFGVERGTLIRVPAIANLMIDSTDRPKLYDASGIDLTTPWNFQITSRQALMNGFFSRIGVTEVVLEWCVPNISEQLQNNKFTIRDSSGALHSITMDEINYTVAQALTFLAVQLNQLSLPGYNFTIQNAGGLVTLIGNPTTPIAFSILPGKLAFQLDLNPLNIESRQAPFFLVNCPDLRPYRYIDFTCSDLTAVQDVKDASTVPSIENQPSAVSPFFTPVPRAGSRDVLVRWYFAFDDDASTDQVGFPILMGYEKFVLRRLYNPPKQIKWEQNFPVGNLVFQVYDDNGNLLDYKAPLKEFANTPQDSNWLMTLQLSEG